MAKKWKTLFIQNHRFIRFLFYCTLFANTETKVRTSCFETSFKTKWKFTPQILELETWTFLLLREMEEISNGAESRKIVAKTYHIEI